MELLYQHYHNECFGIDGYPHCLPIAGRFPSREHLIPLTACGRSLRYSRPSIVLDKLDRFVIRFVPAAIAAYIARYVHAINLTVFYNVPDDGPPAKDSFSILSELATPDEGRPSLMVFVSRNDSRNSHLFVSADHDRLVINTGGSIERGLRPNAH